MRKYGEGTAQMLEEWLELDEGQRRANCPFTVLDNDEFDEDAVYFRFMRRYCIGVCSAAFARTDKRLPRRGTGMMGEGKCPCRIYALSTVEHEARKFIREIREEK